uniref:Peptidase family M48 n=1 Tax=Candidatus Kentrum sp. MB TaxID=2138164 RepID=A0A450XVX1_9GAMM|nr:MAG: Peptidase family M48 [Candidatus Kentron sp. MB]VFK76159.1 MAG: Peptidase family M48 [Candidatus Kentron sp. MB]
MSRLPSFSMVVLTALLITACATSPMGRSQLMIFPEQILSQQGEMAFADIKKNAPISTSRRTRRYVSCVTNALLNAMGEKPAEWEVVVFAGRERNAFALPGKKIGVYKGILKAATNQHMLAAVIGHEIAHVQAGHGNERMSASLVSGLGLKAVELMASDSRGGKGLDRNVQTALNLGIEYGILKPYSRSHESEADLMGLKLMAKAGFKPEQSIVLWQNMARLSENQPLEFLSTHPSSDTRIEDLRKLIPSVMPLYRAVGRKPRCRR